MDADVSSPQRKDAAASRIAPITLLAAAYWRRRLGGISGDGHGATIELTETGLLAVLVAAVLEPGWL